LYFKKYIKTHLFACVNFRIFRGYTPDPFNKRRRREGGRKGNGTEGRIGEFILYLFKNR
jgi:hypothetical protein